MYPLSWPALIPLCFGYGLALIHGSLGLSSLPTFGALICAALLAHRAVRWQQVAGHVLFVVLAIALAVHWLPGFQGGKVIDRQGAAPVGIQIEETGAGDHLLGGQPVGPDFDVHSA